MRPKMLVLSLLLVVCCLQYAKQQSIVIDSFKYPQGQDVIQIERDKWAEIRFGIVHNGTNNNHYGVQLYHGRLPCYKPATTSLEYMELYSYSHCPAEVFNKYNNQSVECKGVAVLIRGVDDVDNVTMSLHPSCIFYGFSNNILPETLIQSITVEVIDANSAATPLMTVNGTAQNSSSTLVPSTPLTPVSTKTLPTQTGEQTPAMTSTPTPKSTSTKLSPTPVLTTSRQFMSGILSNTEIDTTLLFTMTNSVLQTILLILLVIITMVTCKQRRTRLIAEVIRNKDVHDHEPSHTNTSEEMDNSYNSSTQDPVSDEQYYQE